MKRSWGFKCFDREYAFASIIVVSPSLLILMFWIYPSTAYCSPFSLDYGGYRLQKEPLTLTDSSACTSSTHLAPVTRGRGFCERCALTCARTTDLPNLLAV